MISTRVEEIIKSFVKEGQSFISLDIYCQLGTRIEEDEENPIFKQVEKAYQKGLMPNYLREWHRFELESGARADVWRYYKPKATSARIEVIRMTNEKRLEITKLVQSLVIEDGVILGAYIEPGKITIKESDGTEDQELPRERIRILTSSVKKAGFDNEYKIFALVKSKSIEFTKEEPVLDED